MLQYTSRILLALFAKAYEARQPGAGQWEIPNSTPQHENQEGGEQSVNLWVPVLG
jgi:hypothetical protein